MSLSFLIVMSIKLMKKITLSILAICCLVSCKDEPQTTRAEQTQTQEEYLAKNKLTIPKKGQLNELTPAQKKLVQDWLEFNTVYENMKLVNSSTRFAIIEDLGQLAANIDDLEQKKHPKDLNVNQIRSRFLVLKTKALKLQDDATDDSIPNDFIEKEIVEMNQVFNSIAYQIAQASKLNMKPEEILGDALNAKDSTKVTQENVVKEQKREFKPQKTERLIKEVDPDNQ